APAGAAAAPPGSPEGAGHPRPRGPPAGEPWTPCAGGLHMEGSLESCRPRGRLLRRPRELSPGVPGEASMQCEMCGKTVGTRRYMVEGTVMSLGLECAR